MIAKRHSQFYTGIVFLALFALWTLLIQTVDVQPAGQTGTDIGFATINGWFSAWTGEHMTLYHITDWLGLVPVFICFWFGSLGLCQWIRRKRLRNVDFDILLLGIYYVVVIFAYLIFEMIPINYRPVLIDGRLEASYPSSTTLLVLCVMPTLVFQAQRRCQNTSLTKVITSTSTVFSLCMVIGRLISGVHWLTDIIGSVLLSWGLFSIYKAMVLRYHNNNS